MRPGPLTAVLLALTTVLGAAGGAWAQAGTAASQPAASQPAAAARPAPTTAPRDVLRVSWKIDLPVTLALGAAWIAVEGSGSRLGPSRCRWCEPDLNGLDAAGRHASWKGHASAAGTLSDVTAYALTPVVTQGLVTRDAYREGGWRQVAVDNLVIVEAAAASAALVQGLKFASARKRPYVRDLPAGTALGGDANLAFPSGHTALAFSLATASGTVATLHGYRTAPYVWGAGMTLAAFTGYLRMAADKHYASDVIVGAAIGSLVGWAVPYLHYKLRKRRQLALDRPTPPRDHGPRYQGGRRLRCNTSSRRATRTS
jgi:membrane-associated phospholipid phosphatase